jgi:hypothetical protein
MRGEQGAEIKSGEQITVHDEELVRRRVYLRERASSAAWLILPPVREICAEPGTVAEERLDQLREMSDRKMDFSQARGNQPAEENLENGHSPDRHERLRKNGGVRRQSRPTAACKYDDFRH